MFIACVNFVTISIGQSVERTKEVGVRKIVGAQRLQLKAQFWGETLMLSALAFLVGLLSIYLLLTAINGLTGKDLHLTTFFNFKALVFLFLLILIVGLLAGAYPSTVLSRLHPINIIRGRVRIGNRHGLMRLLTIIQFVLLIRPIDTPERRSCQGFWGQYGDKNTENGGNSVA